MQPSFEPDEGIQVEVVGGLVEQHQRSGCHERPCELQPHAPTARKTVDGCIELVAGKTQAHEHRLGARRRIKAAGILDGVVGVGNGLSVVGQLGLAQLLVGQLQGRVALQHEVSQCGGMCTSPRSDCSFAVSSENSDDLPAPLRPTKPTFSPGCKVTLARSRTTFTPRRSVTSLSTSMKLKPDQRR